MKYIILVLLLAAPLTPTVAGPSPHTKRVLLKNKTERLKRKTERRWSKKRNVKKIVNAIREVEQEQMLSGVELLPNELLKAILMKVFKNERIVDMILKLTSIDDIEKKLRQLPHDFMKIRYPLTCEDGIKDVTKTIVYIAVYAGVIYMGDPILTPAAGMIASVGVGAANFVFMVTPIEEKACDMIHGEDFYANFAY